jgi:periplasmic divalent cation tolerance protein
MKESAMSPEDFVVVLVTAGSAEEAALIGRALVEARLAACANVVGPIASIYRWKGAVEEAAEHLLLVKARAADVAALEAAVRARHSYEVPEVLALPIRGGSAAYLAWLAESTDRGS